MFIVDDHCYHKFYVIVLQALDTTWDADDPKFDALKEYVHFTKAALT